MARRSAPFVPERSSAKSACPRSWPPPKRKSSAEDVGLMDSLSPTSTTSTAIPGHSARLFMAITFPRPPERSIMSAYKWCMVSFTLILPEGVSVPEAARRLPELQHRRVGRQDVERLARRGGVKGGEEGIFAVGDHVAHRELGVLEACGHVLGADAAHGEPGRGVHPGAGQHLEIHVPEPGDVPAVGVVVVYGDQDVPGCVGPGFIVRARDEGA